MKPLVDHIGKGIALHLGEAGATVYVTGCTATPRNDQLVPGSLQETAKGIELHGGHCIPVQCDHKKDKKVDVLTERIRAEQDGQLDILVNNAFSAVSVIMDSVTKK